LSGLVLRSYGWFWLCLEPGSFPRALAFSSAQPGVALYILARGNIARKDGRLVVSFRGQKTKCVGLGRIDPSTSKDVGVSHIDGFTSKSRNVC